MVTTSSLLHQAYVHADTGNHQYAKALLESLVSVQPFNIEAWEAYLQLCQSCEELDYLCERVLHIDGLRSIELESILDYYYFLRQNLKLRQEELVFRPMITFELVDQFTYTLKDNSFSGDKSIWDNSLVTRLRGKWLGSLITLGYLVLLIVGWNLQAKGSLLGYWILLALMIGIFINLWNNIFPETTDETETMTSKPINKETDKNAC